MNLEFIIKADILSKSPVLASFKIIVWLILMPSMWQQYIARIDPNLPPSFALADLKPHHWHNSYLRNLLFLGHILWPIWVCCSLILLFYFLNIPNEILLLVSCYGLLLSLVGGILASLIISVAYGIVIGVIGGFLLSLPMALIEINNYNLDELVIFSMAKNIAIVVMLNIPDLQISLFQNINPRSFLTVLLGVFVASYAGNVMYNTTKTVYSQPQYRQVGSIVIGGFISGLTIFLIASLIGILAPSAAWMQTGFLYVLAYDGFIVVLFSVLLALIWILSTGNWKQALFLGLSVILLLGLLTFLKNFLANSLHFGPFIIGIHGGVENALLYILLFALPYVLAKKIANPWAGIIAGIFGSAGVYIIFTIVTGSYSLIFIFSLTTLFLVLGLTSNWWQPLILYPFQSAWNLILYHSDEKRNNQKTLLHWHSAFWDEYQYLPLFGLESYLVMVAERNPKEGKIAIEYLSATTQNWAATEAQIELDAKCLQSYTQIKEISIAHHHLAAGELKGPASALLRSFSRISRDVKVALTQESHYNQRLALDSLEERLDGLLRELTRSSETYALRFRPIAEQWRQILADHLRNLTETVNSRQEIRNPYIIGIPLTEHQEIFVGRSDVSERIERLLLDKRCPPLLLYGQRRTGKTSLLNNLGKLLPSTIMPLFIDLQGPTSLAKDYIGFLYNMYRAMQNSAKRHCEKILPVLTREQLQIDPFTSFDEWLDKLEDSLDVNQTILLTLDEFSALEHIFEKKLLDEESVLGMFRHIIQHRPRIKILLSGSHTIDEFERWASYLINVQTVHISYLQPSEALQLIEQPVKDFELHYEPAVSQHVMKVTRGHPALIQLLCAEIVTLKNKQSIQERRVASINDVNMAIPDALQHGRFFFADISNNQVTKEGLAVLKFLARQNKLVSYATLESVFVHELDASLTSLFQRELIESVDDGYRFQVELIRQWFK
ncbi:MAG: ATP-binding protein [Thiomargarita sp.]|nr:ATP-binding protein [Thiomargarita sp.]